MTTVLKAGGSSLTDEEKIQEILKQARGLDDRIVLTASAQGDTTERIIKAIDDGKAGKKIPPPEDIFQEFEGLNILGRDYYRATGIRDSVYRTFQDIPTNIERRQQALNSPPFTAKLHLGGERLSALAVYIIAKESGYDASLIDLTYSGFPLAVSGDYHGAKVDLDESRARCQRVLRETPKGAMIILPGYGGLDAITHEEKTGGRGASDTVAFGYLYGFQGDRLLILTNVHGILNANVKGGETVPIMDIDEAKDAGSLGAKLPGRRALVGLEKYYEEGGNPEVYITHSQNFDGPKTRIVKATEEKVPVKLVAGRDVDVYTFEGDVRGLQNVLDGSGVDWSSFATDGLMCVAVSQETVPYAERLFTKLNGTKEGNGFKMTKESGLASVGVVGSGMRGQHKVAGMVATTLGRKGVNIAYNMDPGKVSLGYIIDGRDSPMAIEALYGKFFRKKLAERTYARVRQILGAHNSY